MITRRALLRAAGGLAALGALPPALAQGALPEALVYSSPSCGCCSQWLAHLRANGFRVDSRLVEDVTPAKARLGVPEPLWSCHTAVIGGYVVEGHVPAADIKRLLRERGRARGLAVPGMVVGSPGMEGPNPRPYDTIAFDGSRSWIFARHRP